MSQPSNSENPSSGNPTQKSWWSNAWDTFTGAVTVLYHDAKEGVSSLWNGVHETVHDTLHDTKEISMGLINTGKKITLGAEKTVEHLGNRVGKTVSDLGADVKGTADAFSWPLIIGGGAALLFIFSQRQQGARF